VISIYNKFLKRSYLFRERAELIYVWPTQRPEWEFRYLSSALLFDIWQVWCGFCRAIIIKSCAGTKTRTGKIIPARTAINSWRRIAYEALKAFRSNPANSTSTIRFKRHEPTWGDINVLLKAIPALSPANSTTLITGFGLSLLAPKHMQAVRNACAHIDSESMDEIRTNVHPQKRQ